MQNSGKWKVFGAGFASYIFDAMDLTLLAMALTPIMADLSLTRTEAGLLATATLIGIGFSSLVFGRYADNYGRRTAMLWSLVSFSLLTMAIAVANSWLEILVLRFLAGLGLGGLWGIIASYITETWPSQQRGRAAAVCLAAFPVGTGLASFFAGRIIPVFGWRALFLTAAVALIVAIYIYFFVPESEVWKTQRDARKRNAGAQPVEKVKVREVFKDGMARNTILATIVSTFCLAGYWGMVTWLPTYLVKERGLTVADMGTFMTLFAVGQFVGYFVFGWLADVIGKRNALLVSLAGCAVMLPLYGLAEDRLIVFWMGPAFNFFNAFTGLMGSYYGELFPTRIRSTGAGFCFNVGRGFSAFAPFVLGGFATIYTLQTCITLSGVLFLLALVVMAFLPQTEKMAKKAAEAEAALARQT